MCSRCAIGNGWSICVIKDKHNDVRDVIHNVVDFSHSQTMRLNDIKDDYFYRIVDEYFMKKIMSFAKSFRVSSVFTIKQDSTQVMGITNDGTRFHIKQINQGFSSVYKKYLVMFCDYGFALPIADIILKYYINPVFRPDKTVVY